MARRVGELDAACEPLLDAAREVGAHVWIVSEYGHCDVRRAVEPNRALGEFVATRPGPFGTALDLFASRAFAVCDHQLAHVYVPDLADRPRVREILLGLPGVARVLEGEERGEVGLRHERAGDLIALSEPDELVRVPFLATTTCRHPITPAPWTFTASRATTPASYSSIPSCCVAQAARRRRLLQKKLGFRTLFDVVPLDPGLVHGSHGLPASDPLDGPLLVGDGPGPTEAVVPMTAVRNLVLQALELPG